MSVPNNRDRQVSMTGFAREPQELRLEVLESCRRVIDSHQYVLGSEVGAFEKAWAASCGTDHAIGVGNGLDAIEISLRAVGIGPGDEVITTSMTAFATVLGIIRAGATPVLADVDPNTALLSLESVKRCVSPRTRAVLLVHLYGQIRDIENWQSFCQTQGIELIEDCAQAHLAKSKGHIAGSFGRVGAYSFYPTKNLGALGDAGAVVTSDDEVADVASRLRNYGQRTRYVHSDLGLNSRMDEIQAAILSARLKWLERFTSRRREIAEIYQGEISNERIRKLSPPEHPESHNYHLYVVCCDDRDALGRSLSCKGIDSLIHYPVPLQQQRVGYEFKSDRRGLQVSEEHAATCLSVPCHPQMTSLDIERVIDALNSF